MLNRYTSNGDRINMNLNDYLQNQNYNINRSMNMGLNLTPDYNNYNMNLINNKSMANKINQMNQYPSSYNLGMMSPFNNRINQNNLINLLNNNYFNFSNIQNKASSFINNYNINDSVFSYPNNNPNNSPSINIEDIIILQEKLKDIIIALNKTKMMTNECFEFLNFYYNCSIYCQLEKIFTNPIDSNTVRISINYELISIMICYDYSFENEFLEKCYSILENLLKLNYNNLIIICQHILSKISNESKDNIWVKNLSNIINSYKEIEKINNNNMTQIELINYNTNMIIQNLFFILKNYKTLRNDCLINFLNNIRDQTYEQINIFFREYILRTSNLNGSILASVYLRNNTKFNTLPAPYVRTKNNKEFSLVLDLDETLVHFKDNLDVEGSGVLRIRPGINEFLDEVGKYYELILFTTATQDYADLLIDAIEEDKIYFDHRLYREHAVIIDNDFVKDLNRIGRPLDKIIIVDNMPQNFKLQKENGIMIKPFWGEDIYDTALYELNTILVNIAKEGGDIRIGLEKYKDDILKKVSSCISMENI
jgi:Dullard-like phosphatase family protein